MKTFERLAAAAYGGLAALAALDASRLLPLGRLPGACLFYAATGLACPGCGMTRALVAAFQGRVADSLSLHPLALPLLAVWSAWLGWGALNRARGREFSRGFPRFEGARAWAVLAVVLGVYAARLPSAFAALDAHFDGSSRRAAPLVVDRAAPVPPAAGKPVLPDDLEAAGRRFGVDAQKARLALQAPPRDGAFRFAVIGDAEPGRFAWERVFSPGKDAFWRLLDASQAVSPAFILQLGDLVSKGTLENYRALYKRMETQTTVPFLPVMGNHDRSRPNGDADKTLYEGLNGSPDFFVDYGGWRFVALDTSNRTLRDDQMRWLERVVPRDGRCVIFTHVPPAFLKKHFHSPPRPGFASDEVADEKKGGVIHDILTAYFDENSEAFGRLLQERRVARVYMGHIHAFGVARRGPTLFVLSGGGGSPLYPLPPGEPRRKMAHFLEVSVSGGTLTETVHELSGIVYPMPLPPASF